MKSFNGISGKLKIPALLVEFYIDWQRMKPLSFIEFRDNGFYERGQHEQETSSNAGASPSAGWKLETGTAIITIQGNLSAMQTRDVPKGLEVRGGRREEESTHPRHQNLESNSCHLDTPNPQAKQNLLSDQH